MQILLSIQIGQVLSIFDIISTQTTKKGMQTGQLLRTHSYSRLKSPALQSHPLQTPSHITQSHMANLLNYSTYIKQQLKCLQTEIKRDDSEVRLMLMRIREADDLLRFERDGLCQQLERNRAHLGNKIKEREAREQENLGLVKMMREIIQEQERRTQKNMELRQQTNNIKFELNNQQKEKQKIIIQNQKKRDNYNKTQEEIHNIRNKIESHKLQQLQKTEEIAQADQKVKNMSQQLDKTKTKAHQLTLAITKQHTIETNLKQIGTKLTRNLQDLIKNNHIIASQCEIQEKQGEYFEEMHEQFVYELQVVMKDLENEERGREKEEERTEVQARRREQNLKELEGLKTYLSELERSNIKLQQLLAYYQDRDLAEANKILKRVSSAQKLVQKNPEPKPQLQKLPLKPSDPNMMQNYLKYCNKSPAIPSAPQHKAKFNTAPLQVHQENKPAEPIASIVEKESIVPLLTSRYSQWGLKREASTCYPGTAGPSGFTRMRYV